MTVEQVLKVLNMLRDGCVVWPQERRKALGNAIAIINAAKAYKDAREAILTHEDVDLAVRRAEDEREFLFSLLSPEQEQKKEG